MPIQNPGSSSISGTVAVSNFPATVDTNNGTAGASTIRVVNATGATGTQTSVASANTDTTILAANTARQGATVYNDSTAILYLLMASGTSTTSNYSVQIAPQGYYEVPFRYVGIIKGLWATANGFARVTEIA